MAPDNADAEAEVVRIAERESIGPLRDDVAVLVVALERT
jgi:hypothetical protein